MTPFTTCTERGGDSLTDVTTFDQSINRMQTERTIVRGGVTRRSSHAVRLLPLHEFDGWLADAGFSTWRYRDTAGDPVSSDSRRLVVTAIR